MPKHFNGLGRLLQTLVGLGQEEVKFRLVHLFALQRLQMAENLLGSAHSQQGLGQVKTRLRMFRMRLQLRSKMLDGLTVLALPEKESPQAELNRGVAGVGLCHRRKLLQGQAVEIELKAVDVAQQETGSQIAGLDGHNPLQRRRGLAVLLVPKEKNAQLEMGPGQVGL